MPIICVLQQGMMTFCGTKVEAFGESCVASIKRAKDIQKKCFAATICPACLEQHNKIESERKREAVRVRAEQKANELRERKEKGW